MLMALIKCKECGNEYSEYADKCPNCGCPTSMQASLEFEIKNGVLVKYNGDSKRVIIPNGVKKISGAFCCCEFIEYVEIPSSVEEITDKAFNACRGLEIVIFKEPSKLRIISNRAFQSCSSLKEMILPESLEIIGPNSFENANLAFTLPNSIVSIDSEAFEMSCYDEPTPNMSLYKDFYYLGNNRNKHLMLVCAKNENVTTCIVHKDCKFILQRCFYNLQQLERVEVEKGNKYFDARNNCNAIVETSTAKILAACNYSTIPDGIKVIASYAFNGCNLSKLNIPKSVVEIESFAFACCVGLKELFIPKSVKIIGENILGLTCETLRAINVEAKSMPSGWDADWAGDFWNVNYGCSK